MTEIDPSIALNLKPIQIADPVEGMARAYQLKNLALQNQSAQQDYNDNQTLRSLAAQHTTPAGNLDQGSLLKDIYAHGLYKQGNAMQMQQLGVQKTQADIGETQAKTAQANAATATSQFELAQKNNDLFLGVGNSLLQNNQTDQNSIISAISGLVQKGALPQQDGAALSQKISDNPTVNRQLLIQAMQAHQGLAQQLATQKAQQDLQKGAAPELKDVGNKFIAINPLTGQPTGQTIAKGVSPDTQAGITKDYAVAGLNPDGTPGKANQSLVDMIGQNRIVPSDRLESTPRGQAILSAVDQQYPGYDRSTAQAKVAAARDFTVGKDASALRSIGTATKHLDMLGGMVDALNNGNTPLLNKLSQNWAVQTGGTAPTNFDAAKEIVGQEVIKAIVAGGGSAGERSEASAALDKAKTPAQLKGVISTYKTIMGAQHESLLQQRDAAGLPRSTLPDYTEGGGAAHPPAIQSLLDKYK